MLSKMVTLFWLTLLVFTWSCRGSTHDRLSIGCERGTSRGKRLGLSKGEATGKEADSCICGESGKGGEIGGGHGVIMGRVYARVEGPIIIPRETLYEPSGPVFIQGDTIPGGWIVDVKVCAMNVCDTSIRYCTLNKGETYAIRVPAGCYYVYADRAPDVTPRECYYTNAVLCGVRYGCVNKEVLIPVRVGEGDSIRGIDLFGCYWFDLYVVRQRGETLLFRTIR